MRWKECLAAVVAYAPGHPAAAGVEPQSLVFSGLYVEGQPFEPVFLNSVVGWDLFFNAGFRGGSTVIGNIEAGHVWTGHDAFIRPPGSPEAFFTFNNPAPGSLDELDYHATTVGHVLAGSGYVEQAGSGGYLLSGLGMAPEARLLSGAIATEFSTTTFGAFTTTQASVLSVYQAFFNGAGLPEGLARPDVINSSWGGPDPAAADVAAVGIDGLARANGSVALVVAAGNGGAAAVSSPGSGFNNISVGSLGGQGFLTPSGFSSGGWVDFHNPVTGVTHVGVRAAVDLAAPGELLALAAYFGDSGSIGASPELAGIVQATPQTDQLFLNLDGTSYASPIVAGGISLLKDAARQDLVLNHNDNPLAFDTRVIKSVLMASSARTEGWDNGQDAMNVTTQALDLRSGAGALDLVAAADVYFFGTRDLDGTEELVADRGWDAGTIGLGEVFEYRFATGFTESMTLAVALNWFSVREFDEETQGAADVAFSDLNLEVWSLGAGGQFLSKVGESGSRYNNSEFLRLEGLGPGSYGMRVVFDEMVFDTGGGVDSEFFGLAWQAVAIPEPGTLLLMVAGVLPWFRRSRRGQG